MGTPMAAEIDPDLKVMFITGFAAVALNPDSGAPKDAKILSKPFHLRDLVSLGAILGGTCWPDPDLNSAANIAQGKVFFNFDFTPPYPAEHITFRSHLVNTYISEVFA